jgi:hypothetical protein
MAHILNLLYSLHKYQVARMVLFVLAHTLHGESHDLRDRPFPACRRAERLDPAPNM